MIHCWQCRSGDEIGRNIAEVASAVYLTARSFMYKGIPEAPNNMHRMPWINRLQHDGTVLFMDGQTLRPDSILYCTGYKYTYPFLEKTGLVSTGNSLTCCQSNLSCRQTDRQTKVSHLQPVSKTAHFLPASRAYDHLFQLCHCAILVVICGRQMLCSIRVVPS